MSISYYLNKLPCVTFWKVVMINLLIAVIGIVMILFVIKDNAIFNNVYGIISGVISIVLLISWTYGWFREDCTYDNRGNYTKDPNYQSK
jgi:membrane protein YdbS with pleckstrin-like domain